MGTSSLPIFPWTYGWLGSMFVSPAMHRWHHARDAAYANTNLATLFSVFDRAFGTLSVPHPCTVPLSVGEGMAAA
jgi:sterol desaturase/sphingolipid hydroxylase (fatty acid hydroxylase superfamily)